MISPLRSNLETQKDSSAGSIPVGENTWKEVRNMTKRTITILWLIGIGVMIVGGLLALFSSLALASHIGAFTANYQFNNYVPDSTFWTLVSFILLGGIAALGGIAVQLVAWIGAVINTNRLADKTWFNILLWVGIAAIVLNLLSGLGTLVGWGLMIAYIVGGPDGMAVEPLQLRATPTAPPQMFVPTGPPQMYAPTASPQTYAPTEPPKTLAPTG
jgi:hypothetical protein